MNRCARQRIVAFLGDRISYGRQSGVWDNLTPEAIDDLIRHEVVAAKRNKKARKARKGKADE